VSRRNDRVHAFCLIFQLPFAFGREPREMAENYLNGLDDGGDHGENKTDEIDRPFIEGEFFGTVNRLDEIDMQIKKALTDWDIERIANADLAIMRLAVYEMAFGKDVPPKVAINEAVELAKLYSTGDSPKFVNGILGSVAKNMGIFEGS
jgi:N utilization substance protein B